VALEQLKAILEKHPGVDSETGVLLFADRQVAYQQLFEVLERIRQSGLHRISLQAETERAP
jgi:biopolymer transport protein ExbD